MTDYTRKVDIVSDSANVANRKKIVYVDASSSTTLTAGSSETVIVQPPEGKTWRILSPYIRIDAPPSASSGNHWIEIRPYNYPWFGIFGSGSYDANIRFIYINPQEGSWQPSTEDAILRAFNNLKFSYDYPLNFVYQNGTDVDQTNSRIYKFMIEEEDEATS